MREENFEGKGGEDTAASGARLKYAVIAFAVVEFVALALVVYYKAAR